MIFAAAGKGKFATHLQPDFEVDYRFRISCWLDFCQFQLTTWAETALIWSHSSAFAIISDLRLSPEFATLIIESIVYPFQPISLILVPQHSFSLFNSYSSVAPVSWPLRASWLPFCYVACPPAAPAITQSWASCTDAPPCPSLFFNPDGTPAHALASVDWEWIWFWRVTDLVLVVV